MKMITRKMFAVAALLAAFPCLADQVQLTNGDKISGSVTKMDEVNVVVSSPILGTVKLLRADVRSVRLGTPEQVEADIKKEFEEVIRKAKLQAINELKAKQKANAEIKPPALVQGAGANPAPGLQRAAPLGLPKQAAKGNEIDQAISQLKQIFPAAATPVLQGQVRGQLEKLLSGQLGVMDIRNQAADASKQLRDMKADLQKIGGWSPTYDLYLGILDNFVERADAGETLK